MPLAVMSQNTTGDRAVRADGSADAQGSGDEDEVAVAVAAVDSEAADELSRGTDEAGPCVGDSEPS